MALLAKDIITGSSMVDNKSSSFGSNIINQNLGQLCVNPVLIPLDRKRRLRKGVRTTTPVVVSAISEDLVKLVRVEKGVSFKVKAVLTVRNKVKEDLTETIVRKLDAFAD
ncbi:putative linoleate 13S-lipoxygenase [Helianthus annuus]|uniref:Linoleate 13S-lipoxygenase n=1 Tax=Helianthus annuus TaxID=4232 RepID=A0A9K3IVL4_HELAN|nr:putative linoleate 13S-lipoxygenase [Helianthus annuus]KAJ0913459.1 putative linoleate 13S-lipoxygenase [Helianthus annuus]KAJ0916938.1 putative linoleate 13S-lipoxygenase [Helianthus annuus]